MICWQTRNLPLLAHLAAGYKTFAIFTTFLQLQFRWRLWCHNLLVRWLVDRYAFLGISFMLCQAAEAASTKYTLHQCRCCSVVWIVPIWAVELLEEIRILLILWASSILCCQCNGTILFLDLSYNILYLLLLSRLCTGEQLPLVACVGLAVWMVHSVRLMV